MIRFPERAFKWMWLVNGVLLFGLCVSALFSVIEWSGRSPEWRPEEVELASPATPRVRAVRLGRPRAVPGTDVQIVPVYYGRDELAPREESGSPTPHEAILDDSWDGSSSGYRSPTMINLLFVAPGDSVGRLLLDRKASILQLGIPSADDPLAPQWVSYVLALEDTDHDGRLGPLDERRIYVSDLEGGNLHAVSDDPDFRYQWHQAYRDGETILVVGLDASGLPEDTSTDRMPQVALLHHVLDGVSESWEVATSLLPRAAAIVSR